MNSIEKTRPHTFYLVIAVLALGAIALDAIFNYQGAGPAPEVGLPYLFWLFAKGVELFRWPAVVLSIGWGVLCLMLLFKKTQVIKEDNGNE